MNENRHLLIIGAGELGLSVGKLWKKHYPGSIVVAETLTPDKHKILVESGLIPRLRHRVDSLKYPHILFCIPPSQGSDFQEEATGEPPVYAKEAVTLLFTSSTTVFKESNGGVCDEHSSMADNPHAMKSRQVEELILANDGKVVRLAHRKMTYLNAKNSN
ncbi:MAG: hypothetical protein V3V31_08235 [Methylococcales bacterium]